MVFEIILSLYISLWLFFAWEVSRLRVESMIYGKYFYLVGKRFQEEIKLWVSFPVALLNDLFVSLWQSISLKPGF